MLPLKNQRYDLFLPSRAAANNGLVEKIKEKVRDGRFLSQMYKAGEVNVTHPSSLNYPGVVYIYNSIIDVKARKRWKILFIDGTLALVTLALVPVPIPGTNVLPPIAFGCRAINDAKVLINKKRLSRKKVNFSPNENLSEIEEMIEKDCDYVGVAARCYSLGLEEIASFYAKPAKH